MNPQLTQQYLSHVLLNHSFILHRGLTGRSQSGLDANVISELYVVPGRCPPAPWISFTSPLTPASIQCRNTHTYTLEESEWETALLYLIFFIRRTCLGFIVLYILPRVTGLKHCFYCSMSGINQHFYLSVLQEMQTPTCPHRVWKYVLVMFSAQQPLS